MTGPSYVPSIVSRYFYLDWNFALRVIQIKVLTWISPLIFATGVFSKVLPLFDFKGLQVLLLWLGSASFLIGYTILRLRAPLFLQEYKHFKEYEDFGHSHRWIVWQLHTHLPSLPGRGKRIRELIDKGLMVNSRAIQRRSVYRVCPWFPPPMDKRLRMMRPVNLNNDIYLLAHLDGQRYVLPVQESDPSLKERQRELYWILHGACASSRPLARTFVWVFFLLAALLVLAATAMVVWHFIADPVPVHISTSL